MKFNAEKHAAEIRSCRKCPRMLGPPVPGVVAGTRIISVGQAPGVHEGRFGKPFAWTAGKTLFKWFARLGVDEETYRARVCMVAVCRCFPGKVEGKSGDRKPSRKEIENCRPFLESEIRGLRPRLVIPIGKMAIDQFLEFDKLVDVIGQSFRVRRHGVTFELIALPHPSGLNVWNHREPGRALIDRALGLIKTHPAWKKTFEIRRSKS